MVLICISLMIIGIEHLLNIQMLISHLYIFFGDMSVQVLCPSFINLFGFYCC